MRRTLLVITLAMLLVGVLALPAAAGNPFKDNTSTANGYSTWDSDLINIEQVSQTGAGVYVAVLDTGLTPDWRDFFPQARIATDLGKGFYQSVTFKTGSDPCEVDTEVGRLREASWIGSRTATHGTHVTSTIIGYFYRANADLYSGYALPPIMVRGLAPDVTIIPVKVLADYQLPAMPHCGDGFPSQTVNFGTDAMVAAGIDYATDLAIAGYQPMVINMSLGGPELAAVEKAAIDRAIANGVVVVASAGNEGEAGMGYPGAYAPVISAGSAGWTYEWYGPGAATPPPRYRLWWLQENTYGYNDIPEPTSVSDVYVSEFSSRELTGQQLDVLAPGSWVRGPYPGDPGYAHLPWWSRGIGDLIRNPGNFYYVGGTSMAAPHVTSVAALMLEKNPSLNQAQVESILKSSALPIPAGNATIWDLSPTQGWYDYSWGDDATGAGLIQADAAIAATP